MPWTSPECSGDTGREAASSSPGFCSPGPWRCVALECEGPLLFPNGTSKQQGGPDALGLELLNSNEVSSACSCLAGRPAHLLRRNHHSPLPRERGRGHTEPLCASLPVCHKSLLHQNTTGRPCTTEWHSLPGMPVLFSHFRTLSQEQRAS